MTCITLSILDSNQKVCGRPHTRLLQRIIAALSGDPETILELRYAMRRFLNPPDWENPLAGLHEGFADEPHEAGRCIVDLPGRLITWDSANLSLSHAGRVDIPGSCRDITSVPYHLSSEWLIDRWTTDWQSLSGKRRQQRANASRIDSRRILEDRLLAFLVAECDSARGGAIGRADAWQPPAGWEWRELSNRMACGDPPNVADAAAEIHARWLMNRCAELDGLSPREILLAKRRHIDRDLADRQYQWSILGECPPELWVESAAYRRAGSGSHEVIVYYELVRHLVWRCWNLLVDRPAEMSSPKFEETVDHLAAARAEFLETPNFDDYRGLTPAYVIERERRRLPILALGADSISCPMCRKLAVQSAPSFWHLDRRHLDDDFPFSFHATREAWEEEQREWARGRPPGSRPRERPKEGERAGPGPPPETLFRWPMEEKCRLGITFSASQQLRLVSLCHQFEDLIGDLQLDADGKEWISELQRDLEALQHAVGGVPMVLVAPVALRCIEHLGAIAKCRAELADRCGRLQRQVSLFTLRFGKGEL